MIDLRERLVGSAIPFLACLNQCSQDDAWTNPERWQTFDEDKTRKAPELAKHWSQSIDEAAPELERLNHSGAGVFVTVNQTDGQGRKKANIQLLRGWHADLDTKDARETFDLPRLPLAPSMVVKTPGGWHLYWLAIAPMPCADEARRGEHELELKAIQHGLALFGADKAACTVERVLRVPGFMHRKAEPQPVELLTADGPRYTRDEIRAAFPPIPPKKSKPEGDVIRFTPSLDRAEVLERAGRYLDYIPGSIAGEGENAEGGTKTFNDALKLIDGFDLSEDEALSLLLDRYNPRCKPPWSLEELRKKVKDAAPKCQDRGHLLRTAASSPGSQTSPTNAEPEQILDAVARFAAMPRMEYEQIRVIEAKRLGVRATALDKAVAGSQKDHQVDAGKAAMFPEVEPWGDPVDIATLLDDIRATVNRFIICDTSTSIAVALWVAFTWCIDYLQVAPLAVITAPEKRCGKSQLLDVIGRLSFRPLVASNISPAAVYRVIEAHSPTLLIDEADSFLKENEELRGVINSGHTRQSAFVIRTVGDDHEPRQFSTWGAKAISGIGHLAGTLMDRAIVLTLRRKLPAEKCQRLRHADPKAFSQLASKLARFAEDAGPSIGQARPNLPEELNDRAQDNWEPLLAIADLADGEWPNLARAAALHISGAEHDPVSTSTELLSDIKEIFDAKNVDRIPTADLLSALTSDDTKPWASYAFGKELSPRQLSKRLGEFEISSKDFKINGVTRKGYQKSQFDDVFSRYLAPVTPPKDPQPATYEHSCGSSGCGTVAVADSGATNPGSVADQSATRNQSATPKPAPLLEVAAVADSGGGSGRECLFEGEIT